MPTSNHPSKDAVRAYLQRRAGTRLPPPSPDAIRRELGWGLVPPERKGECGRN